MKPIKNKSIPDLRRELFIEKQLNRVLKQEALKYIERINMLSLERDAAVSQYLSITRSMSWKFTAPIRLIISIINGNYFVKKYAIKNIKYLIIKLIPKFLLDFTKKNYDKLLNIAGILPNSPANHPAISAIVNERCAVSLANFKPIIQKSSEQVKWPVIDIGIVTYNSQDWIEGFFNSLLTLDYPKKNLVLNFVDNSSTDNTLEKLEALTPILREAGYTVNIMRRKNYGFGAGHNAAIRLGSAQFCLVTNIDLVFEENALRRVVATAQADDHQAAAWELRQKPYEHPKFYDPITWTTNWNSHACVLLRREAIESVGYYDENLFMYGEDVELSYRLRRAGYLLRYCPNATVWHYSYQKANQVKPLQYSGSTFANLYIRLKYGTLADICAVPMLSLRLILMPEPYIGARRAVAINLLKLISLASILILARRRSEAFFPFRTWDYEMSREGSFVEQRPLPQNQPLISVITRTYQGRELYLRQAMYSVARQTWENIEHIIVEDGGETMRSLVEGMSMATGRKTRFIPSGKHGRSTAGNAALATANGRWCVFLDDDDLLFADHLEVLATALLEHPDAVASYSLAWEVVTDATRLSEGNYTEVTHKIPSATRQDFDRNVLRHHNFLPIQSILFERSLYLERGGFEEDMDALEDWILWNQYALDNRFVYVKKLTSLYRTPSNPEKISQRLNAFDDAYPRAVARIHAKISELSRRLYII